MTSALNISYSYVFLHAIHREILAGEKLANLVNHELFARIFLAIWHTNYSYVYQHFLTNSFYPYGTPKFSPTKYFLCVLLADYISILYCILCIYLAKLCVCVCAMMMMHIYTQYIYICMYIIQINMSGVSSSKVSHKRRRLSGYNIFHRELLQSSGSYVRIYS